MPSSKQTKAAKTSAPKKASPQKARKPAVLPKSDGDAGVQTYINSMEPWQAAIARRIDALVMEHVPGVRKAIRWRCPFYGVEGWGWFLAFDAFQYHVNLTFFRGTSLDPVPPEGTDKSGRGLRVREADKLDEEQLISWIKQASSIPGWDGGSPNAGGDSL
jgi:hypothetical protein